MGIGSDQSDFCGLWPVKSQSNRRYDSSKPKKVGASKNNSLSDYTEVELLLSTHNA